MQTHALFQLVGLALQGSNGRDVWYKLSKYVAKTEKRLEFSYVCKILESVYRISGSRRNYQSTRLNYVLQLFEELLENEAFTELQ